jgi:hypothetical protein
VEVERKEGEDEEEKGNRFGELPATLIPTLAQLETQWRPPCTNESSSRLVARKERSVRILQGYSVDYSS